jgi:hypothetical protein
MVTLDLFVFALLKNNNNGDPMPFGEVLIMM